MPDLQTLADSQTFAKFLFVFKAADGGEVPSISLALGRLFFERVNVFTLIFLSNDIRRNTLIVCDPEATPYKYLASIRIKATAATIRNPKPQYAIRTGAFMLGGP